MGINKIYIAHRLKFYFLKLLRVQLARLYLVFNCFIYMYVFGFCSDVTDIKDVILIEE